MATWNIKECGQPPPPNPMRDRPWQRISYGPIPRVPTMAMRAARVQRLRELANRKHCSPERRAKLERKIQAAKQ